MPPTFYIMRYRDSSIPCFVSETRTFPVEEAGDVPGDMHVAELVLC